jgi:hypothetical protein
MVNIPPRPNATPDLPVSVPKKNGLPQTAPDGTIMLNASKYARQAVLTAFEMIGGTDALADWAKTNKTDFYTKLFTKTIQKDIEVGARDDVESLLESIDSKERVEFEDGMTIDAEFEMVEEYRGQV